MLMILIPDQMYNQLWRWGCGQRALVAKRGQPQTGMYGKPSAVERQRFMRQEKDDRQDKERQGTTCMPSA